MDNMQYKTQEECIEGMKGIIGRGMIFVFIMFLVFGLILPIHFACVLYNHWKNSDKSVEEGGAQERDD